MCVCVWGGGGGGGGFPFSFEGSFILSEVATLVTFTRLYPFPTKTRSFEDNCPTTNLSQIKGESGEGPVKFSSFFPWD